MGIEKERARRSRGKAILNLVGLFFSMAGSILLFCSLTLKSSNFRLVEKSDGGVAICLNGKLVASGFGGPLIVTTDTCPDDWKHTGPTPEIIAERPTYVPWGLGFIIIGFGLQLPSAFAAMKER